MKNLSFSGHSSSNHQSDKEANDNRMGLKQFGSFLEDCHPSLAQVFRFAPFGLGFNIEVKFPNLWECEKLGIETSVGVNEYVDEILRVVFDNYDQNKLKRYIIFSSFHADICKCLAMKQPQFPVLFLNCVGEKKYFDQRYNSLQNAITFAKSNHLFGVVANAACILKAPHLINVVHKYGLILLTWGKQNNDTKDVDLQMKYGIDGLITDHVQHIRNHLDTKERSFRQLKGVK